jgi:hypothetical protein
MADARHTHARQAAVVPATRRRWSTPTSRMPEAREALVPRRCSSFNLVSASQMVSPTAWADPVGAFDVTLP